MRTELERRGIDIIAMQQEVYRRAISKIDEIRSLPEFEEVEDEDGNITKKRVFKESEAPYLNICNQAIATFAKYSYPTMAAVQVQNMDKEVNEKVIDATEVRAKILADPFASQVAHKATTNTDTGLPILVGGKKEE